VRCQSDLTLPRLSTSGVFTAKEDLAVPMTARTYPVMRTVFLLSSVVAMVEWKVLAPLQVQRYLLGSAFLWIYCRIATLLFRRSNTAMAGVLVNLCSLPAFKFHVPIRYVCRETAIGVYACRPPMVGRQKCVQLSRMRKLPATFMTRRELDSNMIPPSAGSHTQAP